VGQDAFFEGVAEYFRKHHHGNATLGDLLAELETASGRDLSRWSEVWLQKAGVTTLRPVVEVDSNDNIAHFAIRQEVPEDWPTQRPHRLRVGGYDVVNGALERVWIEELDIDGALTEVPSLNGIHRPALILVNDDDLAYAKVRLDDASLATAVGLLHTLPPLPRSLVLAGAWDMTRDAELPARQFIELVLGNVAEESESTVVLVLLRQLTMSLGLYVDPAVADEETAKAADALWQLTLTAEAGSDHQLQFLRAFAGLATTEAQLDNLQALLDDKLHLEELPIDADLAWDILGGLVAGGRAEQIAIELQLSKDATASGQRRAAHARAALPTAEGKRAAWDALVNPAAGEELPNAIQFEATSGFNRANDWTLLEPFVDEYFAMLRTTYTDRTNETAQNLIEGLYPSQLAGRVPDLQAKADAWLAANDDAHDALKRMVIEGRDGVRRALMNQAADAAWGE
jgi:aminopeptidase N